MTIFEEFRRDEVRVLDRLVDGELGQAERRQLLAALDDEPGAWRRCALAFLEAQAWRQELSRIASTPIVAHSAAAALERARLSPVRRGLLWGGWLALAASLFVAFELGTRYPAVVAVPAGDNGLLAQKNDQQPDQPMEPIETADGALQYVVLSPVDGGVSREFRLAVAPSGADDLEMETEETAFATQLLAELEESGYEVKRQQRLLPVELTDGRRLIVPVEDIDIRDPKVVQY